MTGLAVSTLLFLGLDPAVTIRVFAELGLSDVDVNFESIHYLQYPMSSIKSVYEAVLKEANKAGIRVRSLHMPYEEYFLGSLSIGLDRVKDQIVDLITVAARHYVDYIVFHPFSRRVLDRNVHDIVEKLFSQIAHVAEDHGIVIALENTTSSKPWNRVEEVYRLVSRISHKYVKMCLDTGHANYNGYNVPKLLETYGDQIAILHIHDNDGRIDAHRIPGAGTIDWLEFSKNLHGLDALAVIEVLCNAKKEPCHARTLLSHNTVKAIVEGWRRK